MLNDDRRKKLIGVVWIVHVRWTALAGKQIENSKTD